MASRAKTKRLKEAARGDLGEVSIHYPSPDEIEVPLQWNGHRTKLITDEPGLSTQLSNRAREAMLDEFDEHPIVLRMVNRFKDHIDPPSYGALIRYAEKQRGKPREILTQAIEHAAMHQFSKSESVMHANWKNAFLRDLHGQLEEWLGYNSNLLSAIKNQTERKR